MRSIEYFCGASFDPSCGQELDVPTWLQRKIRYAKDTKYDIDTTIPFDSIRSNRIQVAIDKWQEQYDEIFGKSKEVE